MLLKDQISSGIFDRYWKVVRVCEMFGDLVDLVSRA